jgi:hypothetical protein
VEPTSEGPDLDSLRAWRVRLSHQADGLRAEIVTRQEELAQVEERLTLVTKLIEVERRAQDGTRGSHGEEAPNEEAPNVQPIPTSTQRHGATSDVEDAVEDILRAAGTPLHISEIRDALVAQGVPIPGRGDDANIIVRLRRFQDRFTRTARGTYGLSEWGIPALKPKKSKKRPAFKATFC